MMIEVLSLIYKEQPCENWANALIKLKAKVRSDSALPALSVALPRFARHTGFVPFKEPEKWQEAVNEAYGKIPELDIGVRMSQVATDFRRTKNRNEFLKLPLEERVLIESLFDDYI